MAVTIMINIMPTKKSGMTVIKLGNLLPTAETGRWWITFYADKTSLNECVRPLRMLLIRAL